MKAGEWKCDAVYVAGVGAQTPVGRSALKASAAVRCGISASAEHPFMIDRNGEPFVVSMADWLDDSLDLRSRIIQLGIDAAIDALTPFESALTAEMLSVIFALSVRNLPTEADLTYVADRIATALSDRGLEIQFQVCADENAVGAAALSLGCQLIWNEGRKACLIIGVDSHLGPQQLQAIDNCGRLHSVNNSWGFIPGEGAAAILMTSGRTLTTWNRIPLAEIAACTTGLEEKLLGTRTVCLGEGLTQAFRGALSPDDKVSHSYCDLNGETYRADEFGFAVCRTSQGFEDAGRFTAAAECWGDVGAASIPLQVALATSAWSLGYATGESCLCWSSSATLPLRGAVRLRNDWSLPQEARG